MVRLLKEMTREMLTRRELFCHGGRSPWNGPPRSLEFPALHRSDRRQEFFDLRLQTRAFARQHLCGRQNLPRGRTCFSCAAADVFDAMCHLAAVLGDALN